MSIDPLLSRHFSQEFELGNESNLESQDLMAYHSFYLTDLERDEKQLQTFLKEKTTDNRNLWEAKPTKQTRIRRTKTWSEQELTRLEQYRKANLSWEQISSVFQNKYTRNAVQMRYLRLMKERERRRKPDYWHSLVSKAIKDDWDCRRARVCQKMKVSFQELDSTIRTVLESGVSWQDGSILRGYLEIDKTDHNVPEESKRLEERN